MREELARNAANYVPLTPLSFLARAARVHGEMPSFIHGARAFTWAQTQRRCHQLGNALAAAGIQPADVVAVMAANTPEFYECMFGVPMMGAVISPINIRLDAATVAFILRHGEAKAVIADREFAPVMREALAQLDSKPLLVQINDPAYEAAADGDALGADYEDFIKDAPDTPFPPPADEWQALSLNYTSGTTGNPKGVVYSHRGAWMIANGNLTAWQMPRFPAYGWTLPMFHCCGWCFPWSIAAQAGTNVGMRKVSAETVGNAIAAGARWFCGAPIVLTMLIEAMEKLHAANAAPAEAVRYMVAAAPPPAAVLDKATALGVEVLHAYGLTEVYGPAVACDWKPAWNDLPAAEQSIRRARQGVPYLTLEGLTVMDAETMTEVPNDGETMGEVMMRGNAVMRGYYKNPQASAAAFAGGWFHSGDLGVLDADNYVRLKDRAKDVIISGGENISSIEVEDVLCAHPDITAAAVVAQPDEKWGEVPLAHVELRAGAILGEADVIAFCREKLAKFKCPKAVKFGEIPRTVTGKVQKFRLREQSPK